MNNRVTIKDKPFTQAIINNPTVYYPNEVIARYCSENKTTFDAEIQKRTEKPGIKKQEAVQNVFKRAVRYHENKQHVKACIFAFTLSYLVLRLGSGVPSLPQLALETLIACLGPKVIESINYYIFTPILDRLGVNILYSI